MNIFLTRLEPYIQRNNKPRHVDSNEQINADQLKLKKFQI